MLIEQKTNEKRIITGTKIRFTDINASFMYGTKTKFLIFLSVSDMTGPADQVTAQQPIGDFYSNTKRVAHKAIV